MSYEGYNTYICVAGHKNSYDCYEEDPGVCPDCQAELAWWYSVDQTNCGGAEPAYELHVAAEQTVCEHCGLTKVTGIDQYCIPDNCGHQLVPLDRLRVPERSSRFVDNNTGTLYDTEDAAWSSAMERDDD